MRGLDNPQLGNKPSKDQGTIYNCCCTSKSCRHTIRETGIHASDSFSRKTSVFELCWNSRHFIFGLPDFYCFFFFPLPSPSPFSLSLFFTCVLFPSIKSLPSLPPLALRDLSLPGNWYYLGEHSVLCVGFWWTFVLVLTFSASSSALQPLPLEGTKYSFVHQRFYFCSSRIFQFCGCIPSPRLPKLLFNKHCPLNSPSWAWTKRLFDGSGSVWQQNSEGEASGLGDLEA